jgi:gluconate kinase
MKSPDSGTLPPTVFVLFGIPGAGKTTVARLAIERLTSRSGFHESSLIWLDLDCCVSQSLKDNFARGVYPTLQEREEFARTVCVHINEQCMLRCAKCALVSFSFVNVDLRDKFREGFPDSTWILLNTSESIAEERMKQRKDHFYKGKGHATENGRKSLVSSLDISRNDKSRADNSDWTFAPVTFSHSVLNGEDLPDANADRIVEIVERARAVDPV